MKHDEEFSTPDAKHQLALQALAVIAIGEGDAQEIAQQTLEMLGVVVQDAINSTPAYR